MDAHTYEKLCEHGTFYESYTYSKQPKTPKPTNIEKIQWFRLSLMNKYKSSNDLDCP